VSCHDHKCIPEPYPVIDTPRITVSGVVTALTQKVSGKPQKIYFQICTSRRATPSVLWKSLAGDPISRVKGAKVYPYPLVKPVSGPLEIEMVKVILY
jgi:hypothetical protein